MNAKRHMPDAYLTAQVRYWAQAQNNAALRRQAFEAEIERRATVQRESLDGRIDTLAARIRSWGSTT